MSQLQSPPHPPSTPSQHAVLPIAQIFVSITTPIPHWMLPKHSNHQQWAFGLIRNLWKLEQFGFKLYKSLKYNIL